MSDKKQYALITGATSGIGLELARTFAGNGYNLVLVARTESDLQSVSAELRAGGVDVRTISKDLFNPAAAKEIYEEVSHSNIQIDVLVNNAGQGEYGLFDETDLDRELDIIQLNISSVVASTKPFLQEFVKRGDGKILNTSSVAGKVPGPWQSVYHGTKAFIQSWSEAIRREVKDQGVTVTALLPGATDTDFFNKADMLDAKNVQDKDSLSDPAQVAKDGFEALMAGDDMVVSGFKNKVQVAMGKILPDSVKAAQTEKQQEPVK